MRYLGLDLGTRTLGVSISDTTHTIANSLTIIRFNDSDYDAIYPELKTIVQNKYDAVYQVKENQTNKIFCIKKISFSNTF